MKLIVSVFFQMMSFLPLAQAQNLFAYKHYFSNELMDWTLSYSNFKLSEFTLAETRPFDHNNPQDLNSLKSFYSIYKPLLTFSKDSNRFIDIYSYQLNLEKKGTGFLANVDIDQAIYLFDKKTKYWDRIYFGTPANSIDEVIWTNNTQFILVGMVANKRGLNTPMIIVGNVVNKTMEIYRNTDTTCQERPVRYKSPKLKKISIEGL